MEEEPYKPEVIVTDTTEYRSKPVVNMDNDRIRIRMNMCKSDWYVLKRMIKIGE